MRGLVLFAAIFQLCQGAPLTPRPPLHGIPPGIPAWTQALASDLRNGILNPFGYSLANCTPSGTTPCGNNATIMKREANADPAHP